MYLNVICRLLPASQISEATHVIYPEGGRINVEEKTKTETRHVIEQWLEDSIKLKERQEEKLYRVR